MTQESAASAQRPKGKASPPRDRGKGSKAKGKASDYYYDGAAGSYGNKDDRKIDTSGYAYGGKSASKGHGAKGKYDQYYQKASRYGDADDYDPRLRDDLYLREKAKLLAKTASGGEMTQQDEDDQAFLDKYYAQHAAQQALRARSDEFDKGFNDDYETYRRQKYGDEAPKGRGKGKRSSIDGYHNVHHTYNENQQVYDSDLAKGGRKGKGKGKKGRRNSSYQEEEVIWPRAAAPVLDITVEEPLQRLEHSWTLWVLTQIPGVKKWEENMHNGGEFNTVQGYWNTMRHTHSPRKCCGADLCLFKTPVKPAWEDEACKNGGRWIAKIEKMKAKSLDIIWQRLTMCLIGEIFPCRNLICGAVVSTRSKASKISLWISWADDSVIHDIGSYLIECIASCELRNTSIHYSFENFKHGGCTHSFQYEPRHQTNAPTCIQKHNEISFSHKGKGKRRNSNVGEKEEECPPEPSRTNTSVEFVCDTPNHFIAKEEDKFLPSNSVNHQEEEVDMYQKIKSPTLGHVSDLCAKRMREVLAEKTPEWGGTKPITDANDCRPSDANEHLAAASTPAIGPVSGGESPSKLPDGEPQPISIEQPQVIQLTEEEKILEALNSVDLDKKPTTDTDANAAQSPTESMEPERKDDEPMPDTTNPPQGPDTAEETDSVVAPSSVAQPDTSNNVSDSKEETTEEEKVEQSA